MSRKRQILSKIWDEIFDVPFLISAVILLLTSIAMFVDVIGRYFFHSPLPGIVEGVMWFGLVAVTFLAIPSCHITKTHISAGFLASRLSPAHREWLNILTYSLAFVIFAVMLWQYTDGAIYSFVNKDVTRGLVEFPLWWAKAAVMWCSVLMLMLMFVATVQSFRKLKSNIDEERSK